MADAPTPAAPSLSLPKLLVLLFLAIAGAAAVVYLAMRPRETKDEVVVTTMEPAAASELKINTQQAVDATRPVSEKPELGRRYRVRVDSESREGTEGIARIGGMVVFVEGGRPGQEALVEITRLRATTAEAVILKDEGASPAPAGASAPTAEPAPRKPYAAPAAPADDTVYTGRVVFVGKFGDGLVKLNGMSVYVPGVVKGDYISFKITEKRDRSSRGQLVSKLEAPPEEPRSESAGQDQATNRMREARAPHIQAGQTVELSITEKDRREPEKNGVGRIDNLVVIVAGAKPGERLKVRITERKATVAWAEIVERLESAPAAP